MNEIELIDDDDIPVDCSERVCHIVTIGSEKPRVVGAYHTEDEARKQSAKLNKALRGSGLEAYVTSHAYDGRSMSPKDAWDRLDAIWDGSVDKKDILFFLDLVFLDQNMHVMPKYSDEVYQDEYHWCTDRIEELMADAIDEFAGKLSECLLSMYADDFKEVVDEVNGWDDGCPKETIDSLMYEHGFTREQLAANLIRPMVRYAPIAFDPDKEFAIVLNNDRYDRLRIMSKRMLWNAFDSIEYNLSLDDELDSNARVLGQRTELT